MKGEDVFLNAFIGVHAELKFGDWWSYDPAALAKWRDVVRDRPSWLVDVAGNAALPDKPPVPPDTHGTPDNSPVSKAWIAFREELWRDAMRKFTAAVRAGDPAWAQAVMTAHIRNARAVMVRAASQGET